MEALEERMRNEHSLKFEASIESLEKRYQQMIESFVEDKTYLLKVEHEKNRSYGVSEKRIRIETDKI